MNINETKNRLSSQTIDRISQMVVMTNPEARKLMKQVMEMCFDAGWELAISVAATLPAVELIDFLKGIKTK